jgi:hypothetical protein
MRNCLLSLVLKFLGFVVYTSSNTCLVQRGKEWGIKLSELFPSLLGCCNLFFFWFSELASAISFSAINK